MIEKSRMEQIDRWANYCKLNMKKSQKELTPFINAQIENANNFYKRLAKTKNGKEKITQIRLRHS